MPLSFDHAVLDLVRRDTAGVKSIYRAPTGRDTIRAWCVDQLDRWPVPHRRDMLTVNGADTHLVTAGSGGGTVLFVPGTNFNAAVSGPLATALHSTGYRVLVPDVPGQPGLSSGDRIAGAERAAWYGAWLDQLIGQTHNGLPVTIVGHSLGAAIALSAKSPQITHRLLVSPGGLIRLSIAPAVLAASTSWFLRPTPARSARLLKTMLAPGHQPANQLIEWVTLVARYTRTSGDPGRLRELNKAQESTTVVASGRQDVFLPPKRLQAAVRDILGLDLQVIDNAGHLIVNERPDSIATLTTSWLD